MFIRLFIILSLLLVFLVSCEVEEAAPTPIPEIIPSYSPTSSLPDVPIYTNDQVSSLANASLQPLNVSGNTPLQKQITSVSYLGDGIWQVIVEWEYDSAIDHIAYRFYERTGHWEIDSITIILK